MAPAAATRGLVARVVRHGAVVLGIAAATAAAAQMVSIPLGGPPRERPSPNATLLGAPADIAGAVAAKGRPAAMRELDAAYHPAEVLAFLGLTLGARVLVAEHDPGYFGPIIGTAVGPGGRVVEVVAPAAMRDPASRAVLSDAISLAPALSLRTGALAAVRLPPGSFDFALLHLVADRLPSRADQEALSAQLFAALRPDGVVGVIDDAADCAATPPASPAADDFTHAGFVLDRSGRLLGGAGPAGDRGSGDCADPSHRVIRKYRKPE